MRLGRLRRAAKATQTCRAAGEVEGCAAGEKCSVRLGESAGRVCRACGRGEVKGNEGGGGIFLMVLQEDEGSSPVC